MPNQPDPTPVATPLVAMPLSTGMVASTLLKPAAVPAVRLATVQPLALKHLNLAALRTLTMAPQLDNAPLVTAAPAAVDRPVAGADGTTYYVPRARIAERSTATQVPYVHLDRRDGAVHLQVWIDLTIPDPEATALPVNGYTVALVGAAGRIEFDRCDELPPTGRPDGVEAQLFCEATLTNEQTNQVVGTMQADTTAHFEVKGTVHYSLRAPTTGSGPVRAKRPGGRARRTNPRSVAPPSLGRLKMASASLMSNMAGRLKVARPVTTASPPATTASKQHRSTMRLAPGDHSGVRAHFPTEVRQNRAIYDQVTTGHGTEPWARWAAVRHGRYMESPVPDQFFVLPDEYRLAFDRTTGGPAMMVLLVPPESTGDEQGPTSFGGDYTIRCRFSVVPWYDPERLDALRQDIIDHTGVTYPQLLGGGFRSATCALSRTYQSLGSTLVGDGESSVAVDALGFDLVVDCTSEFYTLLSRLMVTDGVDGEVTIDLLGDTEHPETATVPVVLRLDRPALDVLTAELLPPPEPVPDSEPTDDASDSGDSTGNGSAPAPEIRPTMRITNPIAHPVTVASVSSRLLVIDATLPKPIDAVAATADPASFTVPAATGGTPSTIDVELEPDATDLPALYGGVGVDFIGVSVDIDPDEVLAKAHEFGASGDLSSTVEARSYQLEHPDVLPPTHADVFGIEVQLRRGESEPITVFLTRDQPATTVQVSFTLADVLAGARPEQPKFSWRRRNLAGAGTGEWSDWETIVGRQLFISPTGL